MTRRTLIKSLLTLPFAGLAAVGMSRKASPKPTRVFKVRYCRVGKPPPMRFETDDMPAQTAPNRYGD